MSPVAGENEDHDYLKRCVERFRVAARSPGRKLFVVSCFVDSPEKLEEIKAPKLKVGRVKKVTKY